MNLIVDLGNTRCKLSVVDEDGIILLTVKEFKRYALSSLIQLMQQYRFDHAIMSATGKVPGALVEQMNMIENFVMFDSRLNLPISVVYDTPHTLGNDRLAAAVGAFRRFPGKNLMIVDMGTCITVDFVTSSGVFMGGNISPGIQMRLKSMHHYTAKLPLVDAIDSDVLFGKSTAMALQNGGVRGALFEIEGIIEAATREYGPLEIILTGGDADFFVSWSKFKIFAAPDLVIEGLNEILKYNVR
ncbi:MAG: type III pantothenate kinase [Chitinophagales bacterium]|nr:type III pantothenate kinase [Chitinophagales bacterium]